jgi:hypothetical protein
MAAKSSQPPTSSSGPSGFQTVPAKPKERKQKERQKPQPAPQQTHKAVAPKATKAPVQSTARSKSASGIPEIVSKRMARRMAIFCGIPTFLGLTTFPVSYFGFFKNGIELPHVAVLLASLGGLGLGVLGLTYGVLSASWDEGEPGSQLGFKESKLNLGRVIENWKAARERQG